MKHKRVREKRLVQMVLNQYKSLYKACRNENGWVSQGNFIEVYGALIIAFKLIEDKDENAQAE